MATDRAVYSFDIANHGGAVDYSYYFEADTQFEYPSSMSDPIGWLNLSSASLMRWFCYIGNNATAARFRPNSINNLTADFNGEKKFGCTASNTELQQGFNISGVWDEIAASATPDLTASSIRVGSIGAGAVESKAGIGMRNLQRYDITSYAEGKSLIDQLMTET